MRNEAEIRAQLAQARERLKVLFNMRRRTDEWDYLRGYSEGLQYSLEEAQDTRSQWKKSRDTCPHCGQDAPKHMKGCPLAKGDETR